jgi:hypothetical protein
VVRAALTVLGLAAFAVQAPTLTQPQRDSVERGETVVLTEPRTGSAWPAVSVYVFIDATPEQSAATFADVESHPRYIESVAKARISRVVDSATIEVDYTLKVPILPDEDYTVHNHFTASANSYRVAWTMVRASSTKDIVGHALFSPHTNSRTGKHGTLLEYANFVTPGSRLAGLPFVRNRAAVEVKETVEFIAREVNATNNSATMSSRVAAFRKRVGAPKYAPDPRD